MKYVTPTTEWILQRYAECPWIGILLVLMVLDILTGLCASGVQRRLSSKIGFIGMMRKTSVLLVVAMSAMLQAGQSQMPIDAQLPLAKMTAGAFALMESLSILENARRAGVPIPAWLNKTLLDSVSRIMPQSAQSQQVSVTDVHIDVKDAVITQTTKTDTSPPHP
jgi:toxin secretion/phage lysis holin